MRPKTQRGVTLLEMMVVVSLIAILAGISYPSVAAGLETLRINSAAESIVSFLDGALTRADRRQLMTELIIIPAESRLMVRSPEPGFIRELHLPEGVTITRIMPEQMGLPEGSPRTFFVYPGGSVPRIGIELVNLRGTKRFLRVDPITGVPFIEKAQVQP